MKKGSTIVASNPKTKHLVDGKEYKVEWISIGGHIAVRNEAGHIRPYDKRNFKISSCAAGNIEKPSPTGGKLTFADLEVGDRFIDFPTDGDNFGHGGFRIAYNVFVKISKVKITNDSLLQSNAVNTSNGCLSDFRGTMNVIKLNG